MPCCLETQQFVTYFLSRYHVFYLFERDVMLNTLSLTSRVNKSVLSLYIAGFPALIVAITLSIVAGKEGIESFVSDK